MIELAAPSPRANEILIEVHACGMGYVDALVALGAYQVKPPTPYTPGLEISGVVTGLGAEVRRLKVGDRVMASAFGGGLAEYAVAPEASSWRIPDSMTFGEAAGFRTNYITALHGLKDRAAIEPDECLLVFGASGGVGIAAVQIGALLGATIVAAASTEEKRAFATTHGAHHVIDVNPDGWRDRLKVICNGVGPNVIFDPVCGPLFETAFRSQAWRGRHLVVGFAGGPIPKLPVNLTLMKGASLVGVDVRQFSLFERDRADTHMAQLLEWAEQRLLIPPVGRRFPLANFSEAMKFAMSGKGMGKTIVDVSDRSTTTQS
ncbi:NADPH:quinone oxidoreductase family protein [Bradyrhizobium sp. 1]|uniref:NADPH:quinone oxidoreductase family protein n=1 Tax=Bradyrhizobium sp. 1 TaxID=241591 RepID=UPI001FF95E6D|nr:NADPH:quinone oxidoreductase family protein [Bradyrhizobium sp. 1]